MENPADSQSHKSYTNTLCLIKETNLVNSRNVLFPIYLYLSTIKQYYNNE